MENTVTISIEEYDKLRLIEKNQEMVVIIPGTICIAPHIIYKNIYNYKFYGKEEAISELVSQFNAQKDELISEIEKQRASIEGKVSYIKELRAAICTILSELNCANLFNLGKKIKELNNKYSKL